MKPFNTQNQINATRKDMSHDAMECPRKLRRRERERGAKASQLGKRFGFRVVS